MCEAVPGCLTTGYHSLIEGLDLPDSGDRHVLAAAIRAGAQVFVTENVADFPAQVLSDYDMEAQTPDIFVLHLIDLSPTTVARVVEEQSAALAAPSLSTSDVLDRLARSGLPRSVAELRRL